MSQTSSFRNGAYWGVNYIDAKLLGQLGTAGTGITARQDYTGNQVLTLPITNLSVTTTDATTNGAHGNRLLFTFPQGLVVIHGAVTDLTIARVGTSITASASIVGALGTTAAANTNDTLTTTEANIVPSTAATLASGTGAFRGESTGAAILDGTTTPVPIYLNFAMPDASHGTTADALTVNGTIRLVYSWIGDN